MSTRLLTLAAVLVPSLAHADSALPATQATFHLSAGGELLGGDGAMSGGFRARALLGTSFGSASVRPTVAVGGTYGTGYLHVDDMRALDGRLSLALSTFGPEAQLGLRFANGGFVDNRLYAGFAVLRVAKDRRLQLDAVPGVSEANKRGYRASIGASWIDSIGKAVSRHDRGGRDDALALMFLVLAPSQAELAWERDAGSDRYGVMLGWGL